MYGSSADSSPPLLHHPSNFTSFSACSFNAQSLLHNFPQVSLFCSAHREFDLIIVSETWLNPSITDGMVKLEGYTLYRNDRRNRVGGGVAMYVKNCFKFIPILLSDSQDPSGSIEYLIGKIILAPRQEILVASVYRPPNSPFFKNTAFLSKLAELAPQFTTKVIMGDFNADMSTSNPHSKIVNEFLSDNNLQLLPHGITNITTERGTHIDLCIADKEDIISSIDKSPSPFINTHFLITAVFSIFKVARDDSVFFYRQLNSINHDQFTDFLKNCNWIPFFDSHDVNEKLSLLNSSLSAALDTFAPIVHSPLETPT